MAKLDKTNTRLVEIRELKNCKYAIFERQPGKMAINLGSQYKVLDFPHILITIVHYNDKRFKKIYVPFIFLANELFNHKTKVLDAPLPNITDSGNICLDCHGHVCLSIKADSVEEGFEDACLDTLDKFFSYSFNSFMKHGSRNYQRWGRWQQTGKKPDFKTVCTGIKELDEYMFQNRFGTLHSYISRMAGTEYELPA
jgi:hypothetical protein